MNFVDTHAHMGDDRLWQGIDTYMNEAHFAGISKIVNINTDRLTLERGLGLKEKYPWLYNAGATTPHDVEKFGELDFPLFEQMARDRKLIAIGETGLDAFYKHSPLDLQEHFLRKYFRLAKEVKLPLIIHCREAFPDLFRIAKEEYREQGAYLPLVIHCFTGTLEEALQAQDFGWYISFSGIITFKKSNALRQLISHLYLSSIFIETDSPYLAPQSIRGELNRPAFVKETAAYIAKELGKTLEEIAKITEENAQRFFCFSNYP
jgi:TatD DNase family protein